MSYTLRNLMIAAALGFVGILLTTSYIKGQRAELSRGKQEVKVLIAKKDIPAGTSAKTLSDGGYVDVTTVLREDAPPQALHDVKDVAKLTLSETVYEGEYITAHKFEVTSGLNPTEQIKGTERFMAVALNAVSSTNGLIKPGDHIDIMRGGGGDEAVASYVVARDVIVSQTPKSMLPAGSEPSTEPLKVKADPEIYVLQVSDKVALDIVSSSIGTEVNAGLWALLRPSDGAQESKLPPRSGYPNVN